MRGVVDSIEASVNGYAEHCRATSQVTFYKGPLSVFSFGRDAIRVRGVCVLRHIAPLGLLVASVLAIRRILLRPTILIVPTPASAVLKQLRRRRFAARALLTLLIRISHPFTYWPADLIVQYARESPVLSLFTAHKTIYPGHPVSPAPERSSVPFPQRAQRPDASEKALVCVLSANHGGVGLQRVLRALSQPVSHGFRLTVVGPLSELTEEIQLAQALGLHATVDFVGEQFDFDLWGLLWSVDAAIGILEPRRVGLSTASPLKHRTYIAAGLPFITAVHDFSLPMHASWKLQVSDTPEPLDLASVREWLDSLGGGDYESMVAFGANELSPERIAQKVLSALIASK